ncbi:MAG: site-specific DNA-methyltransferase [Candidatus Aenigmarchaeota archaeon]|nr:site-specific DNA-methyltransferase [Candidatus Aenigmarchaeota archaeon]
MRKINAHKHVVADKTSIEIKDYRHADKKRKNNPPVGGAAFDTMPQETKKYSYDPHLDPTLIWSGKQEKTSFDVDVVSLYTHERISTKTILEAVKRKDVQRRLFSDEEIPLKDQIDYYKHDVNWTNRMVLGDSLLVMNSLLHRENMAGKVQCIYIDPPYGISYNSNFQPLTNQRGATDGKQEDLTREPEQIKAYRDTWTLGIHSYLTYLRDRLLLAKELLHETGSIFVQINMENVHLVRNLLDDIFTPTNFISEIIFAKTPGKSGKLIDCVYDCILWYAKDKKIMKYNQLFHKKTLSPEDLENYTHIEFKDGKIRRLKSEEKNNPDLIPKDIKIFKANVMTSQTPSQSTVFPVTIKEKTYTPGNRGWRTNENGMKKLIKIGRVFGEGKNLWYKQYFDDFPVNAINNLWNDTVASFQKRDYVVQTIPKVISRCILMTTDAGDLVLDPTCGGGTTALCAEMWGRRWITCDTSRIALALSKQRIITANYHYYKLLDSNVGISAGFVYEEVPHVTLKSIVKELPPENEKLIDKPIIDKSKVRVTGPFTFETIPQYSMDSKLDISVPDTGSENVDLGVSGVNHIQTLIDLLYKTGVNISGGRKLNFQRIEALHDTRFIHAKGIVIENEKEEEIAISFGPPYGPVTIRQVVDAVDDSLGYKSIIFAGFEIEAEAQNVKARNKTLIFAKINPDILIGSLIKTGNKDQLFSVFGEPDIEINKKNDEYTISINGVDIYNPTTGNVEPGGHDDITAWFIDTDYDQKTSFLICQAFFPIKKDAWEKLERALKGLIIPDKFEKLTGLESLPFKSGDNKKIAIKVIDHRGNEVISVHELK